MTAKRASILASLGLSAALLAPAAGQAGSHCDGDCAPPSYPCVHYWFPTVWRLYAHHGPKEPLYAADLEPGVSIISKITYFPCPYAAPSELYSNPTPGR